MNNIALILPILIPLVTASLCILTIPFVRIKHMISLIGSFAHLLSTIWLFQLVSQEGIQVSQMGNWSAPFGITIVADSLSAILVLVTGILGLVVSFYSFIDISLARKNFGFFSLFHILIMGVCGAFLTGDLFNLYVWFEVLLISSFALMALGGEKKQVEGAVKYVLLSLMSSLFFLAAVGTLYGITGTLNMADLSLKFQHQVPFEIVTIIALLFLVSFGIKAAVFPMFFWLPASYPTPPVAVSAIFAGLLTKVGVYAMIRTFTLLFISEVHFTHNLILLIAGLTMVVGVFGALIQRELRRILSFQIVSHVGFMVMGLGLYSPLGLTGSVFYLVHHMVVITNLFLISGVIQKKKGTFNIDEMGGLFKTYPFFSILFLIPALALSGVPPFSGFFPKVLLMSSALEAKQYLLVFAVVLVGILTLYSMVIVWMEAFLKKSTVTIQTIPSRDKPMYLLPITVLTGVTLLIGVYAEPLFKFSKKAADELLNPKYYIETVLRIQIR